MGRLFCVYLCVLLRTVVVNSTDSLWNSLPTKQSGNGYPLHRRSHLVPLSSDSSAIYGVSQSNVFLCIIDVLKYWHEHQVIIVHEPELFTKARNIPVALKQSGIDAHFMMWDKDYGNQSSVIEHLNREPNKRAYIIVCCDNVLVQSFLHVVKFTGNLNYGKAILVACSEIPPLFNQGFYMQSQLTFLTPHRSKKNFVAMKNNDHHAIHFASEFELYDVFMLETMDHSVTPMPFKTIKFVQWYFFKGISRIDLIKTLPPSRLEGRTVQEAVLYYPPFSIGLPGLEDGECRLPSAGLFYEIGNIIAEHLNLRFNYSCPEEPIAGYFTTNGTVTGLLGMFANKLSNVAFRPVVLTSERLTAYRLMTPLLYDTIDIIWKKDPKILNAVPTNTHLSVFPLGVWLGIASLSFALLLCVAASLKVNSLITVRRKRHRNKTFVYHPNGCIELAASRIRRLRFFHWLFSGEFLETALKDPPGAASKILVGTGILWLTLVFAHYTSTLKSFLMAVTPHFPFSNMETLASNTEYRIGTLNSPALLDGIFRQNGDVFRQIQATIKKRDDNLVRNATEGLVKLCEEEKFVFLFGRLTSSYYGKKYLSTCPISILPTKSLSLPVYFGLRSDFPYEMAFNKLVMLLKENGVMKRLLDKYFPVHLFPGLEFDQKNLEDGTFSFDLIRVIVPIRVLCVGILLSLVTLLLEIMFYQWTRV